jgi:predicted  nucleic acid-binding Zn-ribbon protein
VSDILTPGQVAYFAITMPPGEAAAYYAREYNRLADEWEALRARADEAAQQVEWWREESGGYQRALVRDEARVAELEAALRDLRNEVDCRIEHGANSNGHLEYVRDRLDAALSAAPPEEPT